MILDHKKYQICSRCIMDTSAPRISFDSGGVCDYCLNFEKNILPNWHTDERGFDALFQIAKKIKAEGKNKAFDCIIGLSGGLDSSYTAYIAKEIMGLRPLLLHVDAGWNTDRAVNNIEKIVNGLKLDLYTEVVDWEEMKDLQLAFLKSQIPDQDLPQDAAFFSALYKFANQYKVKYVLTGFNYSTECCREPEEWGGYPGIDKKLFYAIHNAFGTRKLETFPLVDILAYKLYYRYVKGMRVINPLNFVPYLKKDAEDFLEKNFHWEKFQHKHHESRFTRFYEDYWMPRKFGFEKRRAHFSSLIMTNQLSREDALDRISRPELEESFLKQEFDYIANKLGIIPEELQSIFDGQNKTYANYKNKMNIIKMGAKVMCFLGLERRLFRTNS